MVSSLILDQPMATSTSYDPSTSTTTSRGRNRRGSEVSSPWSSAAANQNGIQRAQSETSLSKNTRLRQRRNTYVIDKVNDDSTDLLSSTAHIGGIKALLEKANKGQEFRFPPEVKAYITSHFQMIRDENRKLNLNLESMKGDMNKFQNIQTGFNDQKRETENLQDKLKAIQSQLEREKAKNKAMMKRIKLEAANNVDSTEDVIWFNNNNINNTNSLCKISLNNNNNNKDDPRPKTAASNHTTSANTSMSVNHTADEKKVKWLNKTVRLRHEIAKFQKENSRMKQVLLSELGTEDEVNKALHSDPTKNNWEGRAVQIANLKAQLDQLKIAHNSESGSDSPKLNPIRGTGDGSSRNGSLSPATSDQSQCSSEQHQQQREGAKNWQIKLEEADTVRKVSEVERERLGQHVRVLTKRLKFAEDKAITSEAKLRSERRENAKLQKQLEKARVELRESSANSEAELSQKFSSLQMNLNKENIQLREELAATKENLESLTKKREDDLDMYLKLASDSKRMFSQSLKEAVEKL